MPPQDAFILIRSFRSCQREGFLQPNHTKGRAERIPAHVHTGRFMICELSFLLSAVCTESGLSTDSPEQVCCSSLSKSHITSLTRCDFKWGATGQMKAMGLLDWLPGGGGRGEDGKLNTSIGLHVCLSEPEPRQLQLHRTRRNQGDILSKWKGALQRKGGPRRRASLKKKKSGFLAPHFKEGTTTFYRRCFINQAAS